MWGRKRGEAEIMLAVPVTLLNFSCIRNAQLSAKVDPDEPNMRQTSSVSRLEWSGDLRPN